MALGLVVPVVAVTQVAVVAMAPHLALPDRVPLPVVVAVAVSLVVRVLPESSS